MKIGLKGLRGSLEASLDSDDITPFIKLACQAGRTTTDNESGTIPDPNVNTEDIPLSQGTLNAIIQSLRSIAEKKESEIRRACEAHASQVRRSTHEVQSISTSLSDINRRQHEIVTSLQRLETGFKSKLATLEEDQLVQERIEESRNKIAGLIQVLGACQRAHTALSQGHMYHAKKMLNRAQSEFMDLLSKIERVDDPARSFSKERKNTIGTAHDTTNIWSTLQGYIQDLDNHLNQKINSRMNQYLTDARSCASMIGNMAIQSAKKEKERKTIDALDRSDIVREIQRWLDNLDVLSPSSSDIIQATTQLMKTFPSIDYRSTSISTAAAVKGAGNRSAESSMSVSSTLKRYTNLDIDEFISSSALKIDETCLIGGVSSKYNTVSSATSMVFHVLDISPFLECLHLAQQENTLTAFFDYYTSSRNAQLGTDLTPPNGSFFDCHKPYLDRIVGFFVLEMQIASIVAMSPCSVPPSSVGRFEDHVTTLWEGAAAAMTAEILATVDVLPEMDEVDELISDAMEACDALDVYGGSMLSTLGIRDALNHRYGMMVKSMMAVEEENGTIDGSGGGGDGEMEEEEEEEEEEG